MQGIANPRSKLAQFHYSKGRHKKERLGNEESEHSSGSVAQI